MSVPEIRVRLTEEQLSALDAVAAEEGLARQDFVRVALGDRTRRAELFPPLKGTRPGYATVASGAGPRKLVRIGLSEAEEAELLAAERAFGIRGPVIIRRAVAAFLGSDSAFHSRSRSSEDPMIAELQGLRVAFARVGTNLNAVAKSLHLMRLGRHEAEVTGNRLRDLIGEFTLLKERAMDALHPAIDRPPPRAVRVAGTLEEAVALLRTALAQPGALSRSMLADAIRHIERAREIVVSGSGRSDGGLVAQRDKTSRGRPKG